MISDEDQRVEETQESCPFPFPCTSHSDSFTPLPAWDHAWSPEQELGWVPAAAEQGLQTLHLSQVSCNYGKILGAIRDHPGLPCTFSLSVCLKTIILALYPNYD